METWVKTLPGNRTRERLATLGKAVHAMKIDNLVFPSDFIWGSATSSYQIEGSTKADGKGESIWDRFCTTPGAIERGETGEIACDHYRRWPEDITLMSELGLTGYRFSIAWPRILPEGHGKVNQAGLDFYDRLVDRLLEANITPFVTLYHWDLPQALQDNGGWANRETIAAFAEYADIIARRLGDRVDNWITHNEPWVVAFVGNLWGRHAPGLRDMKAAFQISHNLLVSHGQAVPILRGANPRAKVGITLNLAAIHAADDTEAAVAASKRADGFHNRWFLDPLFLGSYPQDIVEYIGENAPEIKDGDMETIGAAVDFLGINYYSRNVVFERLGAPPVDTSNIEVIEGSEYTTMPWEVYPDGLCELLERVHRDYHAPAYYITENGAAFPDTVEADGAVHDERRLAYLASHFAAASKAIEAGVPLKGYFVWSLFDNFEWERGYSQRFGIIHIDFPTGKRTWKDSARWYQQLIAAERALQPAQVSRT